MPFQMGKPREEHYGNVYDVHVLHENKFGSYKQAGYTYDELENGMKSSGTGSVPKVGNLTPWHRYYKSDMEQTYPNTKWDFWEIADIPEANRTPMLFRWLVHARDSEETEKHFERDIEDNSNQSSDPIGYMTPFINGKARFRPSETKEMSRVYDWERMDV